MASSACPVCGSTQLATRVKRSRIPTLQNRVYHSFDEARAARSGRFELVQCGVCGFAHNAAFDEGLMEYDEHYDNLVPSAVMTTHYQRLINQLAERHALEGGMLLDVGCGKGAFLDVACKLLPSLRGLGIDPSFDGEVVQHDGRLRFLREPFQAKQVATAPTLAVCRHVVEHMARPVEFLASVQTALQRFPRTPVFVEVPDLDWIVRNGAFWDFCYEHCNYFNASSLRHALVRAGFAGTHAQGTTFGDQYLWIEHIPSRLAASQEGAAGSAPDLAAYAAKEGQMLEGAGGKIDALRAQGRRLVVWGMATKGVMFANLLDPARQRIDHCIDINVNKQGKYIPLSAHRIEPPAALASAAAKQLAVIVMNPVYQDEVKRACLGMALRADFFDASGARLH
jgi:hypothetical protein